MKGRRIAIVYPESNLDTVPSLCNAALMLSQHGYRVDIFTRVSPDFERPIFDNSRINLIYPALGASLQNFATGGLALQQLRKRGFLFALLRTCYRAARRLIDSIYALISSIQVWRLHRQSPYRCFIGVDPMGLVQAHYLAKFIRVPVVYYSLELLLSKEITGLSEQRLKKQEIILSRQAPFVIIQDQERAQLLAKDNQISMEKFVLVPNAPLGPARRRPSTYWHQKFSLSPDHRIVLHAGSLGKWTGIEGIVNSVKSWPEHWVLVVHTRSNTCHSNEITRLREKAVLGRVFFSLEPATRQEYDLLVDEADIGIAFYVPTPGSTYTQSNIQTTGLSSGKIAYYLRSGLPVIVNKDTSISELVTKEGCGISVDSGQDISRAIAQIAENYQDYSERAYKVFDNYFDFERRFQEVIMRIDSLDRRQW